MSRHHELKYRTFTAFQRWIGNPVLKRLPVQTLIETTGRASGLPRRTPIGGRLAGRQFWFVSEYGDRSQYVRNILADPRVRVRVKGRWYTGTAHVLHGDDARARLKSLPRFNSAAVLMVGAALTTVRVDLTD
ncbi:nitroreductase family deazaflavin-dependent oxidoreductase [Streptomyces rhizosphaerihabitans]|uniref:nitroreductase family deazaflavin-dependent oxidoreductase n=1 Tax=Streptomyces rhizosphaerihabitans TaxID=1266770 RepID=UPI0021C131B0|nr:nitroreductase family deazaflavin-dependent oxidoreductase [Streptomyces rhizosphaerihabitans]MCT9009112.1 nitroreductase family deazaflavin-dependent oxidoreductase [Streptomyces rhizosphaerihabitans]